MREKKKGKKEGKGGKKYSEIRIKGIGKAYVRVEMKS